MGHGTSNLHLPLQGPKSVFDFNLKNKFYLCLVLWVLLYGCANVKITLAYLLLPLVQNTCNTFFYTQNLPGQISKPEKTPQALSVCRRVLSASTLNV